MPSILKPVANHLHSHRKFYAGAAIATTSVTIATRSINKRIELWTEFFADPEAFNAKYPCTK